jgi:hypothetical protein
MMMPTIEDIASDLNAAPADLPGLWNVPGYPELTTGQLISVWRGLLKGVEIRDVAVTLTS